MKAGERKTTQGPAGGRKLPLLLKIVYTLFVSVLPTGITTDLPTVFYGSPAWRC